MRLWIAILVVLAALGAASRARADGVRELRYDTGVDVAVTAVGGAWWLSSELMKAEIVADKCRWCSRAEDGADLLNPFDRWMRGRLRLVWRNAARAATLSNVLGFVVEPAAMMGLTALASANERAIERFPVDALLITQATVIAADLNQLAKFAFARERPFVHYLPRASDGTRASTESPSDDNLSFFSGHTTLAFAIGTSAATVTSLRGYRLAPLVWAAGLTMGSAVGYLRIAADKHYFSDVLVGAIVGTVVGVGVPLVFHSAGASSPSANPNPPSASAQALSAPAVQSAFSVGGGF